MKCIAVDDESPALFLLEDNIKRIPFLQLVKSCSNAFEALEYLKTEKVDLLFLDIEMPEINGMELLQTLPSKPMVILVTAYKKYAIDGYGLDVVDYLLKPVPFDRFLKAVNKAHELFLFRNQANKVEAPLPSDHIFVHADYKLVKINFKEVLYIEGLKDYVKVYISTASKPIITKMTMKSLEEKLPAKDFIRVHKSFIVAIDKINSIQKNRLEIGSSEIPLGDNHRDDFFKKLDM